MCSVNAEGNGIKPNIKSERNTIILREIPSATAPADVEAIFEGCANITSVRSDVGDTWFVTMGTEEEAVKTLLALRNKTFNSAPIKARLKSENLLKSFFPTQNDVSPIPNAQTSAYSVGMYGSAYYGSMPMYATPNGKYDKQRKTPKAAPIKPSKDVKKPANSPAASTTPKSKKEKKQTKKGEKPLPVSKADRQPILNSANFPPLPGALAANITLKYSHDDIMEIVKHMDESDCILPKGKMNFDAHAAVLTPDAHPDLLKNQRTYSIDQAREALRQGRPIRSDSVGSSDYESMMYGEEYTKVAREERQQAQTPDKSEKTPMIGGYAAALINGAVTPLPAPVVTKKSEKKAESPSKASVEKPKETQKAKKIVEPVVGAWGGRSFLDVVKDQPKKCEKEENEI